MNKKRDFIRIEVDLDGVVFYEDKTIKQIEAPPIGKMIETINTLYKQGHTIIVSTSRPWRMFEKTLQQLNHVGLHFSTLHMGRPCSDIIINDRNIEIKTNPNEQEVQNFKKALFSLVDEKMKEERWA